MQLGLSYKRYRLDIPPRVWSEFFEQFTDENQGRLITLKLVDEQLGDFTVLRRTPLHAIAYHGPDHNHDLLVTVGRPEGIGDATYTHRIVQPRAISIVTDEDGLVLSCTIIHHDQSQSTISFQS
ncbi:DUF5335 family protein [Leptolyngbya sp. KIOST-1]|uniref:DUF5335 family protein n=1 Tax=Leptolyngbya sp. KIOST-1 TaxID=1229172 RepID=UPI000559CD61|nr:DUF5335 family protein [Leptolyngbya sp. KIOST-1]